MINEQNQVNENTLIFSLIVAPEMKCAASVRHKNINHEHPSDAPDFNLESVTGIREIF